MVSVTEAEAAAREFAVLDAMIRETHPRPGDTRTCPGCGRPQHYTGTEAGWCHDAATHTHPHGVICSPAWCGSDGPNAQVLDREAGA